MRVRIRSSASLNVPPGKVVEAIVFKLEIMQKSGSLLTFCTFGLPIVTRRDVDQPSGRLSQRPDRLPLVVMSQYVLDHHLEGEKKRLASMSQLFASRR
jgi:hypothetical protein